MDPKLSNIEEWKKLDFRSGLEIHHQIDTSQKLFCHCPVLPYSNVWQAELLRHMRPTMSELGEYDGTALMEFKTKKEIIYRLNRDTVCTYEMDDNPPFPINEEAVDKALTIALAFNCKIVGELHIIRKQYLDGSIPAGFQRTTIIGVDGKLPLSSGREVNIIQVGLEEDACREVSDEGHRITFFTDRLSIPLIEVVTEPTLETPAETAEAAMRIGRMLRAIGFARRGIGAGRQDVNLSVKGGTRVEIKGVPRIPRIPQLLSYEATRQWALLEIRDELLKLGYQAGDRPGEYFTFDSEQNELDNDNLNAALMAGDIIRVVKIPDSKGLISKPFSKNHTYADEFSGRVRVVACLDQFPNIYHTDTDISGLSKKDQETFKKLANCDSNDVAVIVWGSEADTRTAAEEILDRWAETIIGIPNETRQALADNSTDFERVLPGPDRMYPDTDLPPVEIHEERILRAAEFVPEAPWDKEKRYQELGLDLDMVDRLAIDPLSALFDRMVKENNLNAVLAGEVLTRLPVRLSRLEDPVTNIDPGKFEQVLTSMAEGELPREILTKLFITWNTKPDLNLKELQELMNWTPASDNEISDAIDEAISETRNLELYSENNFTTLCMANAMKKLEGRVKGRSLWEKISKSKK